MNFVSLGVDAERRLHAESMSAIFRTWNDAIYLFPKCHGHVLESSRASGHTTSACGPWFACFWSPVITMTQPILSEYEFSSVAGRIGGSDVLQRMTVQRIMSLLRVERFALNSLFVISLITYLKIREVK